jgi:hypothetical protein
LIAIHSFSFFVVSLLLLQLSSYSLIGAAVWVPTYNPPPFLLDASEVGTMIDDGAASSLYSRIRPS